MKIFTLALLFAISISTLFGKNPLWENQLPSGERHYIDIPYSELNDINDQNLNLLITSQLNTRQIDTIINAEFAELIKALDNDPIKIFNYVRNTIDYEHYYGLKKGAELTFIEGSGNDSDQCALLAKLLRLAGHNINFDYRDQLIYYTDMIEWIGLDEEPHPGKSFKEAYGIEITEEFQNGSDRGVSDLVAKQAAAAYDFCNIRDSATATYGNAIMYTASFPEKASILMQRVCLKLIIDDNIYYLDPSYKRYEKIEGIEQILSHIGYDRDSLLSEAEGSSSDDFVQSLNTAKIADYLSQKNTKLIEFLNEFYPNHSIREIISGKQIIKEPITSLNDAFPLSTLFAGEKALHYSIPEAYQTKIKLKINNRSYTIPTYLIKGRKISLTFNETTEIQLNLDDEKFFSFYSSNPSFNLEISVTQPNNNSEEKEIKIYKKHKDFAYVILYAFTPSGQLLQKRNQQLSNYLDSNKADDSIEVRTEILNIMGLTWMYQTYLVSQILASQNQIIPLHKHRFGRMGQEEGFYIDIGLQRSGHYASDSNQKDGRLDNTFQLESLLTSALEHAIIEQMQPNASAVSTVNIIRTANQEDQKIYLANSDNWDTSIKNKIDDHYSASQITEFTDLINNQNAKLFLPYNDNINLEQWTGSGWIIRIKLSRAGMIIGGDYSGGYSTSWGTVSSPNIWNSFRSNPITTYRPPSTPSFKPSVPPSYNAPKFFGSDPVDMSNGSFIYAHTDLNTGTQAAPRGLSFARQYNSNTKELDQQNLGYGWTHSLHMRTTERTASEEALGLGTPQQFASLLTSSHIAFDLYRDEATPKEWGVAVETVGWFTDQMTNNAVSITIGDTVFQFIKQPDGSYTSPANSTMSLTVDASGNYHLKQRHGNTFTFEPIQSESDTPIQRIAQITDIDGQQMTFHYHSDDRLNYVQDAYNRRYTFAYDSDNRITSVTDSTDNRKAQFSYDTDGNLTQATDPEAKNAYYDYALTDGTDPSETAASEHRIVRLRNHDNAIITQNVWGSLGRVSEQYLHGDTENTWKLRYTGSENTEENPAGEVTTYFYDERGRAIGKLDPTGFRTTMSYDGQDHVISENVTIVPATEDSEAITETTTHSYDGNHNRLQINYPRGGGTTTHTYDTLHRQASTTDPEGATTTFSYFTSGVHLGENRPQSITDPLGITTFSYYDSGNGIGQLKTVTDPDGLTTENAYDSYGQPDWTDAPGNYRTDYSYSSRGDLQTLTDPIGTTTHYTYNKRRQVTQVTHDQGGADQASERYSYDNQGLLSQTIDPEGITTSHTYSPTEKPLTTSLVNDTTTTEDDPIQSILYDGRDWETQSTDALGRTTAFNYYGNQTLQQITPTGDHRHSTFTYDGAKRILSQNDPGAGTTNRRSFAFNYAVTNTEDGDSTNGYPRTQFTDADEQITTTEYNRRGQIRYYQNKQGQHFEFRYDALGRPTHTLTPSLKTHQSTYTHRGSPLTLTEPSGDTVSFTYNADSGRLNQVTYTQANSQDASNTQNQSQSRSFTYDANGNPLTLSENNATHTQTYDALNRVLSSTDSQGNTLHYQYYDNGKLKKLIYPGGTEFGLGHIEYTYWKTGRLKEVIDKLDSNIFPRTTTHYWNLDGKLARIVRPNGTERKISYDAIGRPYIVEEHSSDGTLIALYKNSYYPSDEPASIYQLPASLSTLTKPAPFTATYDADNRLATYNGSTVTHDLDGNMTHGPLPNLPDGTLGTYHYDSRNRLTSADGLTYTYDPEGNRSSLTNADGTTRYIIDSVSALPRVLSRTQPDGSTTHYIYGVGLAYQINSDGSTHTHHYDHLGNTIALTDDDGAVTDRVEYSPYGIITHREGTTDTPFLYSGQYGVQTDANGLIHMRARYYNPITRRFINADPIQFEGGTNWYLYANGNPILYVDPSGLDYIGNIQYNAGAFMFGYGRFEGQLQHDEDPNNLINVSGSLHPTGLVAGYFKGEQEIRINADTPKEALGNQGGFFLADVGLGAGPINIGGVSGSLGAHRGEHNADLGKLQREFHRPGISTTFDPANPGSYLEKPRPGIGVSLGFFGTRVKEATRYEPFEGYYQPISATSEYKFKTNIK